MPGFRRRMARRCAPDAWMYPNLNTGLVIKFNEKGEVLESLWDLGGQKHPMITSIREHKGVLYLGGIYTYNREYLPFPGLRFMEVSGMKAVVASAGLQFEPLSNIFIILRGNAGKAADVFRDLFSKKDMLYGYGLTLGYNSLIGPIELSLMRGGVKNKFIFYVNIGYRF